MFVVSLSVVRLERSFHCVCCFIFSIFRGASEAARHQKSTTSGCKFRELFLTGKVSVLFYNHEEVQGLSPSRRRRPQAHRELLPSPSLLQQTYSRPPPDGLFPTPLLSLLIVKRKGV
jgi:hypothetical protein